MTMTLPEAVLAIPEGAACTGTFAAGVEFVDVDLERAQLLAAIYCARCPVVDQCDDLGEHTAPHRAGSVFGGVFWPGQNAKTRTPIDLIGHTP